MPPKGRQALQCPSSPPQAVRWRVRGVQGALFLGAGARWGNYRKCREKPWSFPIWSRRRAAVLDGGGQRSLRAERGPDSTLLCRASARGPEHKAPPRAARPRPPAPLGSPAPPGGPFSRLPGIWGDGGCLSRCLLLTRSISPSHWPRLGSRAAEPRFPARWRVPSARRSGDEPAGSRAVPAAVSCTAEKAFGTGRPPRWAAGALQERGPASGGPPCLPRGQLRWRRG